MNAGPQRLASLRSKEELLQGVPISVTAIGERLDQLWIDSLTEISRVTPSLTIAHDPDGVPARVKNLFDKR